MIDWSPRYLPGYDNGVLAGSLEESLELISRSVESVFSRRLSRLPYGCMAPAQKDHAEVVKALSMIRRYLGDILECE